MQKQELWKESLPVRLAQRLMVNVYVPLTAVISLDAAGDIVELCLVDTQFGIQHARVAPCAAQVWMMTNHPEGRVELSEQDVQNLRQLRARMGAATLRVFIAGEDIGCVEVTDPASAKDAKDTGGLYDKGGTGCPARAD